MNSNKIYIINGEKTSIKFCECDNCNDDGY